MIAAVCMLIYAPAALADMTSKSWAPGRAQTSTNWATGRIVETYTDAAESDALAKVKIKSSGLSLSNIVTDVNGGSNGFLNVYKNNSLASSPVAFSLHPAERNTDAANNNPAANTIGGSVVPGLGGVALMYDRRASGVTTPDYAVFDELQDYDDSKLNYVEKNIRDTWQNYPLFLTKKNDVAYVRIPPIPTNAITNVGSLTTTATTLQGTAANESFLGAITLHKISKTGTYADLMNKPIYQVNGATPSNASGANGVSIWAPTSAGTSGQILTSAGSGAPNWTAPSTLNGVAPHLLVSTLTSGTPTTNNTNLIAAFNNWFGVANKNPNNYATIFTVSNSGSTTAGGGNATVYCNTLNGDVAGAKNITISGGMVSKDEQKYDGLFLRIGAATPIRFHYQAGAIDCSEAGTGSGSGANGNFIPYINPTAFTKSAFNAAFSSANLGAGQMVGFVMNDSAATGAPTPATGTLFGGGTSTKQISMGFVMMNSAGNYYGQILHAYDFKDTSWGGFLLTGDTAASITWYNLPSGSGSYTLPAATTSALGGIKIKQAADSVAASLIADTATGAKNYRVKLDSDNVAYVNVPWQRPVSVPSSGSDTAGYTLYWNDLVSFFSSAGGVNGDTFYIKVGSQAIGIAELNSTGNTFSGILFSNNFPYDPVFGKIVKYNFAGGDISRRCHYYFFTTTSSATTFQCRDNPVALATTALRGAAKLGAAKDASVNSSGDSSMLPVAAGGTNYPVQTDNNDRLMVKVPASAPIAGTVATAIGTAAKTATLTDSAYVPRTGDVFVMKFTAGNTASNPTLNINGSGAKNITTPSGNRSGSSVNGALYIAAAGGPVMLYYDGTQYTTAATTNTNTDTTYVPGNGIEINGNVISVASNVTSPTDCGSGSGSPLYNLNTFNFHFYSERCTYSNGSVNIDLQFGSSNLSQGVTNVVIFNIDLGRQAVVCSIFNMDISFGGLPYTNNAHAISMDSNGNTPRAWILGSDLQMSNPASNGRSDYILHCSFHDIKV